MPTHSIPQLLRSTLATGDIIYRAASNTWARLGIGSTDDLFAVSSGLPAWRTIRQIMASVLGDTRGQLLRRGSSQWEVFAAQTAGNIVSGDGTDVASRAPHQVFDSASGSTSGFGDFWYRSLTGIARVAYGTSGQVLEAGGAAGLRWRDQKRFLIFSPGSFGTSYSTGALNFTPGVVLCFCWIDQATDYVLMGYSKGTATGALGDQWFMAMRVDSAAMSVGVGQIAANGTTTYAVTAFNSAGITVTRGGSGSNDVTGAKLIVLEA